MSPVFGAITRGVLVSNRSSPQTSAVIEALAQAQRGCGRPAIRAPDYATIKYPKPGSYYLDIKQTAPVAGKGWMPCPVTLITLSW